MTTANDTGSGSNFLPLLAALIVLCLGGAAALTLLTHNAAPVAAPAEHCRLVVQRMPYEAQNALARRTERVRCARQERGAAEDAARRQRRRQAATPGPGRRSDKLTDAVTTVGEARPAVETIQPPIKKLVNWRPSCCPSSAISRSAVGVQKLEGMSRYLERFELMVQRIQQDLNGLASGVSDAAPSRAAPCR